MVGFGFVDTLYNALYTVSQKNRTPAINMTFYAPAGYAQHNTQRWHLSVPLSRRTGVCLVPTEGEPRWP